MTRTKAEATTPLHSLQAPFPYFGGKSKIARVVWTRFGRVQNLVEPFFGSGAVLLANPYWTDCTETANDACGFIANFFRAIREDPEETAYWAGMPVNENDMHAVHSWLIAQDRDLVAKLEGDPDYYDAKIAGRWCWGMCIWIGGGWCAGDGPWRVVNGRLVKTSDGEPGGVERRRPHLSRSEGVHRKRPDLMNAGKGVQRRRPQVMPRCVTRNIAIYEWFDALADRMRRVRVTCGDWSRVLGPSPTVNLGTTAVFLDPPYSTEAGRDQDLYRKEDSDVAHSVRAWCLAHGSDTRLRIALCGYAAEGHDVLQDHGWAVHRWKANSGYAQLGKQKGHDNRLRECIWFSPHCIDPELDLFGTVDLFADIADMENVISCAGGPG